MKILKYIFLFVAFAIFSVQGFAQEVSQTPNASSSTQQEKQLTEDELHEIQQKKYNERAIENARSVRLHLRDFMKNLHQTSPNLAKFLSEKYFGIRLVQYIAAVIILLTTLMLVNLVFRFIFSRLTVLTTRKKKNTYSHLFISKIHAPIKLFAWVMGCYFALAVLLKDEMSVAVSTRIVGVFFWCSIFWACFIIIDLFFYALQIRFKERGQQSTANLMEFLRKVVKAFAILIAILEVLTHSGLNVNTLMASLGIGGMAIAFAAQDTIANVFGSISIIIDRPFIKGDWIKTSSCEGNVEAIGFRSTRIRTFEKTLVTIPNSVLAKESVENFQKMPVRKTKLVIGLTYATTADQIEALLPELRERLEKIDGIDQNNKISVEFVSFGAPSLDIRIVYYTKEIAYGYYAATNRRVNLEIMRIVAEHGLSFAFPSTSVYVESLPKNTK